MKILNNIAQNYFKNKLADVFCLVGSASRTALHRSQPNDIDCLILCSEFLTEKQIFGLLKGIKNIKILGWSENYLRIQNNNLEIGLAHFQSHSYFKKINNICAGRKIEIINKTWAIGGIIPEVSLLDIVCAKIIFDKNNQFKKLQKRLLHQYPVKLKKALLKNLNLEIKEKIKLVKKFLKQKNYFMARLGILEILRAKIRLCNAQAEKYPLPLKHLTFNL